MAGAVGRQCDLFDLIDADAGVAPDECRQNATAAIAELVGQARKVARRLMHNRHDADVAAEPVYLPEAIAKDDRTGKEDKVHRSGRCAHGHGHALDDHVFGSRNVAQHRLNGLVRNHLHRFGS